MWEESCKNHGFTNSSFSGWLLFSKVILLRHVLVYLPIQSSINLLWCSLGLYPLSSFLTVCLLPKVPSTLQHLLNIREPRTREQMEAPLLWGQPLPNSCPLATIGPRTTHPTSGIWRTDHGRSLHSPCRHMWGLWRENCKVWGSWSMSRIGPSGFLTHLGARGTARGGWRRGLSNIWGTCQGLQFLRSHFTENMLSLKSRQQ